MRVGLVVGRQTRYWQPIAVLVLALATAACGTDPPHVSREPSVPSLLRPTTSAPPASAASRPSQQELAEARRFRSTFGLRADDAWMYEVAADPDANSAAYGIPLTQAEIEELRSRQFAVEAIRGLVSQYGNAHPDDWAGAYTDQQRGGILVAQFSGSFERHKTALLSQVRPTARLEIKQVERSLEELKGQAARLDPFDPWLRTVPAFLRTSGVDVPTNSVFVRISSVNPDAQRLFEEHFGWQGFLKLESDGTGARLLPRGELLLRVIDPSGQPVAGLRCIAIPDLSGAYEAPLDAPTTDSAGRCGLDLPATGYWIRLNTAEEPPMQVGIGRAVVVAGEVTEVRLTLDTRN